MVHNPKVIKCLGLENDLLLTPGSRFAAASLEGLAANSPCKAFQRILPWTAHMQICASLFLSVLHKCEPTIHGDLNFICII